MKYAALTLFLALISFPQLVHANEPVGILSQAHGEISILSQNAKTVTTLNVDDPVFIGDTVLTDEGEHAVIEFIDETKISLNGKDGQLIIDKFVYDPENPNQNESELSIFRATFEYASGLVSKGNEKSRINLDFGSIGIRGTHILRTMKDEECWIYLEHGEIDVFNDAGRVSLKPGDGTRLSSKEKEPAAVKPWSQDKIDWIKGEVASPKSK